MKIQARCGRCMLYKYDCLRVTTYRIDSIHDTNNNGAEHELT